MVSRAGCEENEAADLQPYRIQRAEAKTKREEFLEVMEEIIPWGEWVGLILPLYPSGKQGRPPRGIETMLRMFLVQAWFNLSDEGVEDAIYDSYALRKFAGINFLKEQASDASTLLHFRHLLEGNNLAAVRYYMQGAAALCLSPKTNFAHGIRMRGFAARTRYA